MLLQKSSWFHCCFSDTDISQGSGATHLGCGGIFIDSFITNVVLIQIELSLKIFQYFDEFKAYEVNAYRNVCQFF